MGKPIPLYHFGWFPERPKGSDCKSDVLYFVGSNPTPTICNINTIEKDTMKIINDTKLDFDDVLLVPQRSRAASRVSVLVNRKFSFYHSARQWNGIPIMAANMDSVGTFAMSQSLTNFGMITCLHKHYDDNQYNNLTDINTQWFSMGIKDEDLSKLSRICGMLGACPNICIDVANGYTDDFVNFCKRVRNFVGSEPIIMAGNICTPEMVQELILHGGIDIVKVGIGPGSACTTRLKTGVGYPQLSAISECSHAAHGLTNERGTGGLICADGGCRTPADVVKALAGNADFVMLGGMLAGCDECEGEWEYAYKCKVGDREWEQSIDPKYDVPKIKKSLKFYGMSSHAAQEKYGGVKDYRASEGRVITVPYKGQADKIIMDILGGIRSACAYVGASTLKDLPKCAEFIKVNRVHFDRSI
jgi:GMP reductase